MISDVARTSRVLVIDDDPLSVELVKRVLTRAGFNSVESTSEPSIALSLLREIEPHVVLLDLNMPKIDGFAVLATLRTEADRVGSSIIMLTGAGDHAVQVAALQAGASDFVTKPFEHPVLVARVAGAAEMRELQRRLRHQNDRLQEAVAARTARLQETLDILTRAEAELKRSLEHTEAQGRTRAEVVAELAHELRTPLSAICGFSDMMRRQQFGPIPPRYREYAEDIHSSGMHVLQVLNGLLDVSKAEARQEPLAVSMVDIGTIVSDSVKLMAAEAEKTGVDLRLVVKPGIEEVETDRAKLMQIVLNMTSNAVKFTPSGGSVIVEVGPDAAGGAYFIVIRDTGVGIIPSDLAEVTRSLGQTRGAGGKPKGNGFGMPLTRQYVQMLGGTLTITSRPGKGTAVTIRLPRALPTDHYREPATNTAEG
jgi:two-component system, cell cycle sensor histidine kinase PleC